jgi:hypothetical protein
MDLDRRLLVRRPADGVAQQDPVVDRQALPEDAVDIPREIGLSARAKLASGPKPTIRCSMNSIRVPASYRIASAPRANWPNASPSPLAVRAIT